MMLLVVVVAMVMAVMMTMVAGEFGRIHGAVKDGRTGVSHRPLTVLGEPS